MFGLGVTFQTDVFLASLGAGFLSGAVFACFRVLRLFGLRGRVSVFIEDILFFLIAGLFSFIFLLYKNFGVPRAYIFCGETIGFLLWFAFPFPARKASEERVKRIRKKPVKKKKRSCK